MAHCELVVIENKFKMAKVSIRSHFDLVFKINKLIQKFDEKTCRDPGHGVRIHIMIFTFINIEWYISFWAKSSSNNGKFILYFRRGGEIPDIPRGKNLVWENSRLRCFLFVVKASLKLECKVVYLLTNEHLLLFTVLLLRLQCFIN